MQGGKFAMYMRKILLSALLFGGAQTTIAQEPQFGEPATQADIDKRFWAVFPDGENLPDGQGTAVAGAMLFEDNCHACHKNPPDEPSELDPEDAADVLFGGHGTIGTDGSLATVGSYWPYSATVFNYVRRAMPYTAPMSLTNSEYYSLTAYLLYKNGIIEENTVMDKDSLPKVEMPNKDGFVSAYPEIPEKYRTK
jgi:S-disulfanyl-L-cysteine oxidoreductase SoxD